MLTFLSLFFSITYLSLVNPLEKLGDSLVQKTQFTFEFLEANIRITWGQKKWRQGYLLNTQLYSDLRILPLVSGFYSYLVKYENLHSLIPFCVYTFSFDILQFGICKYQNIRT